MDLTAVLGTGAVCQPRLRSVDMTGTVFGVHTGLQEVSVDELPPRRGGASRRLGFNWISVWDHFYGATGKVEDTSSLEAVAMHTALALETSRVQCGVLVYSIGFRHPAVLAKAVTSVDLLSGG